MSTLLAEMDREINEVESERAEARKEMERVKLAFAETDHALKLRLRQLHKAREYVTGTATPAKAGRKAKDRVLAFVQERGPVSQAQITHGTGIGSGHASYAIKALERDGVLRDTGRRVGRSHVFALAE
jgi:chromosome segregation and condensation protein ScpB